MPTIVAENVTFSYLNIFEPRADLSGRMKYSACILIDKSNAKVVAAVRKAIKEAINEGIAKGFWTAAMVPTLKTPLRDGDEELATEQKSGDEYKGRIFLNANSPEKSPPGVVKAEGGLAVPIKDPLEIYSGCKGHVYLAFYPYKIKAGAKGIAVGLNGIYKLEDGDRLDGRKSAETVFSSYAEVDSTPDEDTPSDDTPSDEGAFI